MSDHNVAITGIGAVSPHGLGAAALWAGLVAGRSAAAPIRSFDASGFPVTFACEVTATVGEGLPAKLRRQTDRFAQMALVAAAEALGQAGLVSHTQDDESLIGVDPQRVGAVVASGVGGLWEMTEQHQRLLNQGPGRVRPYFSIAMPLNMAAGQIAIRHGVQGPVSAVVSACASGGDAIGTGLDLVRSGRADVVIAGGAEAAINPLTMAGFAAAGAMSRRNSDPAGASRPFDVARDGFVAGEGAGIVVLERPAHAAARGASVLAHLVGYGATNDAHDPSRPAPDGNGAARALRQAIHDADLSCQDIDHVNAHATSTRLNDAAESSALTTVFRDHPPAVTANKSSIGHLLGAAGAIEAVATVLSLQAQQIPPTINIETVDPACAVDVVTRPRQARLHAVVSNSFGFGGHNAVLVFTR